MKRKTIAFFAKAPMNVTMFRPLAMKLKDDPRLSLLFCGKPDLGFSLREIYRLGGLEWAKPIPRWWAKIRPMDLYISPDMMLLAKNARRSVQIYHGVSFKGRMYTEKALEYDKLFMIGEDMRRRYIERGLLGADDRRIEKIGMPKTDRLLDGSLDRHAILSGAGLDPSRPTILYAPTWRPEASLYTMGRDLMRRLGDMPINLAVKLHDLALDPATNPIDWAKEMPKFLRPNVHLIKDIDIVPWLFASDILISDASSVANEFALLDRPIIFIDVPDLFETYKDTIDLGGWGRKTGRIVSDIEGLVAAVERGIERPEEQSEIRRRAAADIFYNPGRATDAAIQAIYRLLDLQNSK